jgi:hypothetical protein
MDDDLKQKYAPRRDKRHTHVSSLEIAAAQARSLEWRTNDYDFFRLCQSVFDYLDFRYRECGFRIDQFVSRDELMREARRQVELYDQERLADCIDIFRFLYASFDLWIGARANAALDRRRQIVETLAHANAA